MSGDRLAAARRLFQEQRLDESLAVCDEVLAETPEDAGAHLGRGMVLQRRRRYDEALAAYERAVALNPDLALAQVGRGMMLQQLQRPEEALAAYDQALRIAPRSMPALVNRGGILEGLGRVAEALAAYDRALAVQPGLGPLHANRGNALQALGRANEALEAFEAALRLAPDHVPAHLGRAAVLLRQQRLADALAALEQVVRLAPDLAAAHLERGALLRRLGRLEAGLDAFDEALRLAPDDPRAHDGRGVLLKSCGRLDEALAAYDRALELAPDLAEAHANRGETLRRLHRPAAARAAFDHALRLRPDLAEAHVFHAGALIELCEFKEAQAAYRRALELRPGFDEAHRNLLFALNYDPEQTAASLLGAHRAWGARHAAPRSADTRHANHPDPDRPLRVGLVSPSLARHPIGYTIAPALEAADRAQLQLVAYSERLREDDLSARIKAATAGWRRTAGVSDAALAEQIRADRIDILIDLAGHTAGSRLVMFALRPAPVQAGWIGYVSTRGLPALDSLIMDEGTVPPDARRWFTENVVYLPDTRLCYAPPEYAPPPAPPPVRERGTVTFGSFNKPAKMSDPTLRAWARVLDAVPGARLLLKWFTLGEAATRAAHAGRLEAAGIDPARVELRAGSPHAQLLAEYADVDIALDPFPYSGGLTSLEALWQGVPVVTLPMTRAVSRHTVPYLHALGRAEWIAQDEPDYVRIAAELAADPERLAELRRGQRERMAASVLCDGPRLAGHLEAVLRRMWRRWCASRC